MKTNGDDHESGPRDQGGDLVPQPHGGALRPFRAGSETAAAGRAKAAASRREQRLLKTARLNDARQLLTDLVDAHPREQLGPLAAAVACDILARLTCGEIKIRHAGDAADLLRVIVDVARIEFGERTSASLTDDVDGAVLVASIIELRERARVAPPEGDSRTD